MGALFYKSADTIVILNRAIGEVIGRYVPTTVLHSRNGDKQWFDASCKRAHDAKQTAYRAWCRAAMLNIGGNLCLLMLRPTGSRITRSPGIL